MSDVLVICEVKDGRLKKSSKEALSAGRRIAGATGGRLLALAFGPDAGNVAEDAGRYGAETLHVAADAAFGTYSTEGYTAAVQKVVEGARPAAVLFSATAEGRDLAPRLAARLGVGVASDVTGLEWADGKLRAKRPIYSGKLIATVEVDASPAIATCRPNAFTPEESGGGAATVEQVSVEVSLRAKVVDTKVPESAELPLGEADIVVSGGRGLKEPEHFSYIRDLAHALGGAVGASRATVDAGWIDHQHQVGQTGRVVSPNLYIAAGVSGAIQHLAGMSSSKHIIAINKDPEAPIFRISDLGVVGDLFAILPLLTEKVKQAKSQG